MTIRDILVQVDDTGSCEQRVTAAVSMAERFESHLTGLYVKPPLEIPAMVDVPLSSNLVEQIRQERAERAETARARFEAAIATGNINGEWRMFEGERLSTVSLHALPRSAHSGAGSRRRRSATGSRGARQPRPFERTAGSRSAIHRFAGSSGEQGANRVER